MFYFGNKYFTNIICLVSGRDISMLVRNDNPDWWNIKTGNFKILIYKCQGMYVINFNFTILCEERVLVVRMKPSDPQSSKAMSVLPQKQMEKVPDQWKKFVWQRHFVLSWPRGTFSINMKLPTCDSNSVYQF